MLQEKEPGITLKSEIFNYKIYVDPFFSVLQMNREQEVYLLILQSKLNNKMVFLQNFTDYYFSIDFEEIKSHSFSFSKLNNTINNENIKEYFTVYETVDGINYYTIIFKLGESVLGLKLETDKTIENVLQDENMKAFEELFKTINVYEKDKNDIFNQFEMINNNKIEREEKVMNEQVNNLNMQSPEIETAISNEYDYSNVIPTAQNIGNLVQYCDAIYNQLLNLIEEDEKKNIQLKEEYRNYTWKKSYNMNFEVSIKQKNYNNISCKNHSSYQDALNSGQVNHLTSLVIDTNLSFKRGEGMKLQEHQNSFKIVFKPYEISFLRKSNYNDPHMNQIEENIKSILNKFETVNTIFCSK